MADSPKKDQLPVDPVRGDEIMRRAFKMKPRPKKTLNPKRKLKKPK